jgi:hypothetical protein
MEGIYPSQEYTEAPRSVEEALLEELRTCPDQASMRANVLGLMRMYQGGYIGAAPFTGETVIEPPRPAKPSELMTYYKSQAQRLTKVRQLSRETSATDDAFVFFAGEVVMTHCAYRLLSAPARTWILNVREVGDEENLERALLGDKGAFQSLLQDSTQALQEGEDLLKEWREHPSQRRVVDAFTTVADVLFQDKIDQEAYTECFLEGVVHAARTMAELLQVYNSQPSGRHYR